MQRRSNGGFSEPRLGYASFRSFLEEAERKGLVKLTMSANGPDVHVEPAAPDSFHGKQSTDTRKRRTRIRPDLWKAFVDWRVDWRRAYDFEAGQALMFPAAPHPVGELPEYAQLRERVDAEPARYAPIEPITQEAQLEWMRAFAEADPDAGLRVDLLEALASPRPAQAFTNLLRERPPALSRWNRVRMERVEQMIAEWSRTLPRPVNYLEDVESEPSAYDKPGAVPLSVGEEALRSAIKQAVEVMPVAELLRLAIPLEYLIRR